MAPSSTIHSNNYATSTTGETDDEADAPAMLHAYTYTGFINCNDYATFDTGEANDAGEWVALMFQTRHTCSWVGDTLFSNSFYLDDAAKTSETASLLQTMHHQHTSTTTTSPFDIDETNDDT